MKKLILLSLVLIALAGLAAATPVQCAVLMFPTTSGNTGSTCTFNAGFGNIITSLTLTATDDYTGFQNGNPVVSFSGTLNQTSPIYTSLTFCNVTTTLGNSNPCGPGVNPSSTVNGLGGLLLNTYSVNLINAGNTVAGGNITGASIVLNLDGTVTAGPGGNAPEPGTLFSLAGGLLLIGVGALRKHSRK